MAKKGPEITFKAKHIDGDMYEVKRYRRVKSVKGKNLVVLDDTMTVSYEATTRRVFATKDVYESFERLLATIEKAKPKAKKKGRK